MAPKKVLVVLTSADKIPSINKPTGWYLPEFAHPYEVLSPKVEIVVASPKGGAAPVDPGSVELFKQDASCVSFYETKKAVFEDTKPLRDFVGRSSEFEAIFYPGGHGPMFDLVDDEDSIKLIEEFYRAGKPVTSVCHGPVVFANVVIDGKKLVEGREITCFTNEEEEDVKMTSALPFLVEDLLVKAGAKFSKTKNWEEKVVIDGQLITGQNPGSARAVAEAIAKAIGV